MNNTLKINVYNAFLDIIKNKIDILHHNLSDLAESIAEETKSSAGDKYETARALLQTEQATISRQLNEANDQKTMLETINLNQTNNLISKGSLIETDKGHFFMSIGIGKITIGKETIIAISQASPLGKLFLGLAVNQTVELNNTKYLIKSIS